MIFRTLLPTDNIEMAQIIRASLKSHGLDIPGTVYTDPTTDNLFELFREPKAIYFVAEDQGRLLGGCGIFPTKGLSEGYAELVKLYLVDDARGKGLGRKLMETSLKWAKEQGYTHIYLETFNELASAVGLYQKLGFQNLPAPLGESGHHACEIWMLKALTE
jgi:putative acetyltransferase